MFQGLQDNQLKGAIEDVYKRQLKVFEGTILFITHDRHLIKGVANRIVEVEPGRVTNYDGDYDYYLFKSGQLDGPAPEELSLIHILTTSRRTSMGCSPS